MSVQYDACKNDACKKTCQKRSSLGKDCASDPRLGPTWNLTCCRSVQEHCIQKEGRPSQKPSSSSSSS